MALAPALLLAALVAAAAWYLGTGLIAWADRRPPRAHARLLALAGLAAVLAMGALWWSAGRATPLGVVVGFMGAMTLWGWHELAFLLGAVTGPNREPAPPGLAGWARFRAAAATLIHHEIALVLTMLLLAALMADSANPTGALVFALLWALRLLAKLNLHAGVPNPTTELLPPQLSYLASYFRRRARAPGLALTLALIAALATWLGAAALAAPSAASATMLAMLFTLTALGLVEHVFLALPVREAAIWRWAVPLAAGPAAIVASPPRPSPAGSRTTTTQGLGRDE